MSALPFIALNITSGTEALDISQIHTTLQSMDDKRSPLDGGVEAQMHSPGIPARKERRGSWRSLLQIILGILLLQTIYHHLTHVSSHDNDKGSIRRYKGESLDWTPCGRSNDGQALECSSLSVPMDHFNSSNNGDDDDKTFFIPLIRIRGANATRNLLVNPGGPGGSGINFVYRAGKDLKEVVGEDLHIVSFDPRGINGSRPAALCYPNEAARSSHAQGYSSVLDPGLYSPPLHAWTDNFVRACEETTGAEHIRYVNTPQTAADMNSILDALGQEHMVYWGFSYGTVLGQTYASMFPERSERVVIDGVCNIFDWYDELFKEEMWSDTENALAGFFDECAKAGDDLCALAPLAPNAAALQDKVMGFIDGLRHDPITVYLNSTTYGVLDYETVMNAIFTSLYKPKGWYGLADNLAQLMAGNGTSALLAYGIDSPYPDDMMDHNAIVVNNDAISGKEAFPQKEALVDAYAPILNASIFTLGIDGFYQAAQWVVEKTHDFHPRGNVSTRNPLLVLSQRYDPVTPLVSAKVARDLFDEARLVQVNGIGHCSLAVHSTCAINHARDFLVHGKLPDEDVECDVDGKFFIHPDEKADIVLRAEVDGADEWDRLWTARMNLHDALAIPRF